MISYERLIEIVREAERVRCNQLYERFDGQCQKIKSNCKECIIKSLDITENEYDELFKELYG